MTFYIDTSVLIAALTNEVDTARAQAWLGSQEPGDLAVSEWVLAECSAAMSIKVRTGALAPMRRAQSLATLQELVSESLIMLPIGAPQFQIAARFADDYALGLRAGDALHLAIAAAHLKTVVTLDRTLSVAALALGVRAVLL